MNRRWMSALAVCAAMGVGFASLSFAEESKAKDEPTTEKKKDEPKKDDAKKSDKDKKKDAKPINKFCPLEPDNAIDPTVTTTYDGKVVGFCCEDCIKSFKKDPKKYMKSLK